MVRSHQLDQRVLDDAVRAERLKWHKRIVSRQQNERGHRDSMRQLQRASAIIIVYGIAKSAIRRGDQIVKFADRSHTPECLKPEETGKYSSLALHTGFELPYKIPFVKRIRLMGKGID